MERFYDRCSGKSLQILELLATALGMPPESFAEKCCKNEHSTMRINHFPPVNVKELDTGNTCRIWPHFDFGVISLVFRDRVGGLEIEDRTRPGTFFPIGCDSEAEMVVNIGETYQRWSNNVFAAGLHRVTKPVTVAELDGEMIPDRISIAFFCKADREVSVGPILRFVTPQHPAEYDDITALQYQEQRNQATYPR